MSQGDVLVWLQQNPGWHNLHEIEEGTGLSSKAVQVAGRKLAKNLEIYARKNGSTKEYCAKRTV